MQKVLIKSHIFLPNRMVHTTLIQNAGALFRAKRRLPPKNNEFGPLTDLPDWSYKDGRPTPFTCRGQQLRAEKNMNFAKKALELMAEIEETKTSYNESIKSQEVKRRALTNRQLNRKGDSPTS